MGASTTYDLKKQKDQLMKFYTESDSKKCMEVKKTLHHPKSNDLDKVLMEWFQQCQSEKVPLSWPMLISQAKIFREELHLTTPCDYSAGWIRFKVSHGIRQLQVYGENGSVDHEAAERYITEFAKLISDEILTTDQIL